jgi:imidazolonepropionase-like amidohydrolase
MALGFLSTLAATSAATLSLVAQAPVPAPFAIATTAQEDDGPRTSWTVTADAIYTATGSVIENGFVRVSDGEITAVGRGKIKGDFHVAAITPGLVEASSGITIGPESVEQDSESTPHISVEEGLDLFSTRWARELSGGVTTTMVSPLDRNVLGGLPVVLKTGGGDPTMEDRVLRTGVGVRACMGSEPSSGNSPVFGRAFGIFNRRPTTRMGVEWVFRRTFYDALRARKDADFTFEGVETVYQVLDGELPLIVRASPRLDIITALGLKQEFSLPNVVIDGAAEVLPEEEAIVASGVSLILAPLTFDGNTGADRAYMAWNTPARMAERGVTFALSGGSSRNDDLGLALQPGHAMRGGLAADAALAAVTIVPARMLGVDDRVGSIEQGKHADLVFWSGTPFQYTSSITGVMVAGELAVDPRHGEEL